MSEWSVAEPGELAFDEPVKELRVRIVNGTVNVVGTDEGPARLEVSEIEGPPLLVTHRRGVLTVAYEDLPWKGFLKWLDRRSRRRSAVVSLAVPAGTRLEAGVVGAAAVVSGLDGPTEVKGVSGDTTLVGLAGPVRAHTVSGSVEAQALTGDLRFNSVSGDLTVVEAGSSVRADSVSGSMILDLDPAGGPTDIGLTSVSGEIAIRLPQPADARVEANTASGTVSSAFEDLRVGGGWGAKRITGRLGAGNGRLKATTVSGSIALLRRPATEEPWGDGCRGDGPGGDSPGGANPAGGPGDGGSAGRAYGSGPVGRPRGADRPGDPRDAGPAGGAPDAGPVEGLRHTDPADGGQDAAPAKGPQDTGPVGASEHTHPAGRPRRADRPGDPGHAGPTGGAQDADPAKGPQGTGPAGAGEVTRPVNAVHGTGPTGDARGTDAAAGGPGDAGSTGRLSDVDPVRGIRDSGPVETSQAAAPAGDPSRTDPADEQPRTDPADVDPSSSGENSASGRDNDADGAPADGTTDKKVL